MMTIGCASSSVSPVRLPHSAIALGVFMNSKEASMSGGEMLQDVAGNATEEASPLQQWARWLGVLGLVYTC